MLSLSEGSPSGSTTSEAFMINTVSVQITLRYSRLMLGLPHILRPRSCGVRTDRSWRGTTEARPHCTALIRGLHASSSILALLTDSAYSFLLEYLIQRQTDSQHVYISYSIRTCTITASINLPATSLGYSPGRAPRLQPRAPS